MSISPKSRPEDILLQIPTFNLLIVAPTLGDQEKVLIPLLKGLFGVSDLNLVAPGLAPKSLSSKSNSRIKIIFASGSSSAKALAKSLESKSRSERIRAVWFLLSPTEGEAGGITQEDVSLGEIPTLMVIASLEMVPQSTLDNVGIRLRMSGVAHGIVRVNVSDTQSLAELSKSMEAALVSDPDLRVLWVAAQRISGDEKIATSISKGMKLFSIAVGASAQPIPFIGGATGVGAIGLLSQDIVSVYNFPDPGRVLMNKTIGNIFYEAATGLPLKWFVSFMGLSTISGLWESPASARTIMQSIADLVLILDALFTLQSATPSTPVTTEEVGKLIKLYEKGGKNEPGYPTFRREQVHSKLGKSNISTFNVWKSFQRKEAQKFLAEVIESHRYRR